MYTSSEKLPPLSPICLSRLFMNLMLMFALFVFIVVLVLNAVFLEPLFQEGVNIIHDIQVGFSSKAFQVIMNIFSVICNTPVISIIFLLQMGFVKSKIKAIIHLSFFLIGFHIIAILKQAYQQSRPIWVSSQINNWQWFCPTDFGNPSGHSYVAFPLFQPIISKYKGFENLQVAWGFVILFGIVVPFSRMYLGVHSMNQIFFGFSFGMIWIITYRYGLRELFYKSFSRLLKLKKLSLLIIIALIHIVLTIIPIIIFKVRSDNTPLDVVDLANLNRLCGSSISSIDIQTKMLELCILHSVGFGFMYGMFALKYSREQKLYLAGRWNYTNKVSALLHCIAQILCVGVIPAIVVLGFGSFWHQPYSKFIGFNLSITVGCFLYIWLTPKIQRKYSWIDYQEEDKLTVQEGINKPTENQFSFAKGDQYGGVNLKFNKYNE